MMNNTTRWLCLCTIGICLGLIQAPPTMAQDNDNYPTAESLYTQGIELSEAGRLLEAKETLQRVDIAQLPRALRSDLVSRLEQIDNQLAAMPESELRIRKASLAVSRDDLRGASRHVESILASQHATAPQQARARQIQQVITDRQAEIRPQIPAILETAFQAYEDGNYGKAKSGLEFVHQSGVALDPDQQAQLTDYISRIYELEAVRGQFNSTRINLGAVSEPDADAAMQPDVTEDAPTAEMTTDEAAEIAAETESFEDLMDTGGSMQPEDEGDDQPMPEEPAEELEPDAPADSDVTMQPVEEQPATQPSPIDDLVRQAQQAKIEQLLQEAREAANAGNYPRALSRYLHVLAIQPGHPEATRGRDDMQVRLNEAQAPLIDDELDLQRIQAEALRAEFDNLLEQAAAARDQGDFDDAINYVSRARVLLDINRTYFSQTEYEQRVGQAESMRDAIQGQQSEQISEVAREREQEVQLRRDEQRRALELERQARIAEKLMAVRRLQQAQKYDEAMLELNSLLFLDPGNPGAQALYEVIRDLKTYQEYNRLRSDRDYRLSQNSIATLESSLLPINVVEYPEDWPSLSQRRQNALAFLDSPIDRQVAQALATQRVPINFANVRFEDAVDFVAEVAQINVDVDWRSLEQNFIDRDTPINLRLNDQVSLETALDRMLRKLGDDDESRPHYAISEGILTISTKDKLEENRVNHLYDIRDLLVDVPDFDDAPEFDLESLLRDGNTTSRFDVQFFPEGEDEEDYDRGKSQRLEKVEAIKQVITSTIDKLSWEVNGGDVGVIQEINGNLVITTTPQNHRQISNLLAKLREIRSLQINVESRFLLVSEDFFEQIGFDFDLYWGGAPYDEASREDPNLLPSDLFVDPVSNTIGPRSQRQFISLFDLVGQTDANGNPVFDANGRQVIQEVLPDAGIFQAGRNSWTPMSLQQDTLGLSQNLFGADGQSFAGQALAATPALSYAVTYLDEIQVDLLIQATQADRRSVQLTAPKLTFFNGQRSFVQITTSQFFVSDLQPVVGTSSAGFDPQLSPLREGVVLDVEGTVSADRRYVTMTVLTTLANVLDIKTTAVPIVVGGQVVSSDDAAILSQTAFIERPEIQISRVNTTVTVPDRGTILLGGQSVRNDIEIETGVPVLSKVPVLNRFFTNRIMSTEERTLFILIRPTIIIQQEQEEMLYPGLQDAIQGTSGIATQF